MFRLDGKIALVSGASRGLGLSMASSLAKQGAHVVLNGRDADVLKSRVCTLEAEGLSVSAMPFDVTDSLGVKRASEEIVREHGHLDILIANAGIQHRSPISEFEEEDFRRVVDTNLTGVWILAKEVSKFMADSNAGRIVFTGSITAEIGRPTISAYIASKGAVHALARQLAVELGDKNITVNAIAPGYFATEMNSDYLLSSSGQEYLASTTAGRMGELDELTGPLLLLASEAGSFMNGTAIPVDGGHLVGSL